MRTLLFAGLFAFLIPLSGCDSTGIDSGETCYTCGANGGNGRHGDHPGGGDGDKNGGNDGGGNDGGGNDGGGNDGGGNDGGGNDGGGNDGGGNDGGGNDGGGNDGGGNDGGGNDGGGNDGGGNDGGGNDGGGNDGGGNDGGGNDGGGNDGGGNDGGGNDGGGNDGGGNDGGGNDGGGNDGGGNDGSKSRFVQINPATTYLRVSMHPAEDAVGNARAVPLSEIGISPGEAVCFRALGDFFYVDNLRASDLGKGLVTAVFSRTNELGGRNELNRVVGALEAGSDVFTANTFLGDQHTDISEDFDASDACVTVPSGAQFIFFSARDDVFNDNVDVGENGQPFGVLVQK